MKTRVTIHWLAGVAGGLLLAVPALVWAQPPWGPGGVATALEECETELDECLESPCAIFPGDGQTGALLSYTEPDPPDGTFIDDNTRLMWEIKEDYDGFVDETNPHDADNKYTWSETFDVFLAQLNAGTGFAGYTDWRVPTVKELQSLVDYTVPTPLPAVAEDLPGATAIEYYWSSTLDASIDDSAWNVLFRIGYVSKRSMADPVRVRAVRGGW